MKLELTKRTDLALRFVLTLDRDGERVKANSLAAEIGTSPGYLPQIARPLVKRRWVRSEPGPNGGYAAATALGTVSLLDLIEAMEGPIDSAECVLVDGPCAAEDPCALHAPWSRARSLLVDELRKTRVLDVPLATKSKEKT